MFCFVFLFMLAHYGTKRKGEGKKVEQLVFKCDTIEINSQYINY